MAWDKEWEKAEESENLEGGGCIGTIGLKEKDDGALVALGRREMLAAREESEVIEL
jgi:hypothetical protein